MHWKVVFTYIDVTGIYLKFENIIPYFFRKSLKVSKNLSILIMYAEGIFTAYIIFINSIYIFTGLYQKFELH